MTGSEFSRPVEVSACDGQVLHLVANEQERAALARRFDLLGIARLEAQVTLHRTGREVEATGLLIADYVQACAISAEDLPVTIREDITLRFVPEQRRTATDEEIEIDARDCDEIAYAGNRFDLGEALAQSLALTIDPFAAGPEAEAARAHFGEENAGPFSALSALNLPREAKP